MSDLVRYIPEWPFPDYKFVPGENPHPKKAGGHMEGEKDPLAESVSPEHPETSQFLRYALDLFNFGYYWESHVYFEALWNTHGRKGESADFFKAMIKLGAAGVKLDIGQAKEAQEHFLRARELLLGISGEKFLGFDLKRIVRDIEERLAGNDQKLIVKPEWK